MYYSSCSFLMKEKKIKIIVDYLDTIYLFTHDYNNINFNI